MLKTVLYYLMLLLTAGRLADIIYILSREKTSLPSAILIAVSVMLIYGLALGVKRFIGSVRLGQLMAFYLVQTLVICFNILYVALWVPVEITLPEMLLVGNFLEIIINVVIVSMCIKRRRARFVTVGEIR